MIAEPETDRSELLTKLTEVADAIGEVPKDGRNDFHNYDYTSIEGVVKAVRGELLKRGILVTSGIDHIDERQRQTNQGVSIVTTAHLIFTVFDSQTGERLQIPWAGQGDDPADKGLSKAITDARKTFLIVLLNLARGDDTEADRSTDERTGPAGTQNLIAEARGLNNAQLNAILVAAGLAAQQAPFGAFARIPNDKAQQILALIDREKNPA